jgi:integral membrane protein (TIGR01906 family)
MLFASLLTTTGYLRLSKGLYATHDDIYYDHDYAIERIMGYLNYRYDDLEFGLDENDDSIIMRDTELSHMVDVKNLYTMLRVLALGSLIIGVSLSYVQYKNDKKEFYKTIKLLPYGPLAFIIIVGGYMVIDFNTAFRIFHELFFTNDDWILYSDDVLILLLPQNFWMVSGLIILVLFSLSIGTIYYLNEKYLKNA